MQYLNGELPPRLVPIQNNSGVNKNVDKPEIKDNETGEVKEIMDVENSSKVQSLIDENIKLEKANRCNKKKAKARPKGDAI